MIVPDSSVLVAGFDPIHPFFPQADLVLAEVERTGRLAAHTIAETCAVLSAPRGPYPAAVSEMAAAGVVGGAVWDGLIALESETMTPSW